MRCFILSETRFDREERIVAMAGGDRALGVELAKIFLVHYGEMHQQLKAAVVSEDPSEVRRMVHTIEGSLGALGSSESIEALMDLGQAGRDLSVESFMPLFLKYERAIDISNCILREITEPTD